MSPEERVRSYIPLIDFIAEIAYPNSEVVLHDVRNEEHSLVAIRNGQLSGREIGASMTDFAARVLSQGRREGKDFLTNYIGRAGSSGKFLKSSTFFIKDDNGEIIGMLGINSDISAYADMHRILTRILAVEDVLNGGANGNGTGSNNDFSVRDLACSVMDQVLNTYAADATHMTGEEKKEVVDILNEKGVFLLKGTIAEVAQRLELSEQTVYRYLR